MYLVLLILVIALMVMLRKCSAGEASFRNVAKSGGDTIDVAIEYTPPLCYTIDDTLGGFDYDLLRVIAHKHNLPIKFHPVVTLENALSALDEEKYDILVAQFPMTKENRELWDFTTPVNRDVQVLVQLRNSKTGELQIKSLLDLGGDSVWVVKGSPMRDRLVNLSEEMGDTIIIREDVTYGAEQLFLRVASGEIRLAVMNKSVAQAMSKNYDNIDATTTISFEQNHAWVMKKGNDALLKQFNAFLQEAQNDSLYETLLQRYNLLKCR